MVAPVLSRLTRASMVPRRAICSMLTSISLLPSTPLPYRGVSVDISDADVPGFAQKIAASVEHWREQGSKSCMLRLPVEHAGLATVAAQHGFEFHRAEGRHAVMKLWLKPALEDKVPPYATHQVGIAGLVMDKQGRILLVKEWRDNEDGSRSPSDSWKLPGGLLERGESFEEAVTREVSEETGIETNFKSILCFWHRHGLTWGQSDLYYVARLEPRQEGPGVLRPQPEEISDATWMHVGEFMATQKHPLIRSVLTRMYGLDEDGSNVADGDRPVPFQEMCMGPVKFSHRNDPFPTYFGVAGPASAAER
jgi:ADP-ribose pyrophosphatase YjhB (NUDIX family)